MPGLPNHAQRRSGLHLCTGAYQINKGAVPDPNAFVSWLIGSVETTQVAGTQPAYLACTVHISFGIKLCGSQYQIFLGSPPDPSTHISWFIGYPYTTLVAGSHSAYLACTLQTVLGITQCSGSYQVIMAMTPNPSVYQSWLIGYVAP